MRAAHRGQLRGKAGRHDPETSDGASISRFGSPRSLRLLAVSSRGMPETVNAVLRFDYVSTVLVCAVTLSKLLFYRCFSRSDPQAIDPVVGFVAALLAGKPAHSLRLARSRFPVESVHSRFLATKYALQQNYRHRRYVARGASSEILKCSERGGSLPMLDLDHGASPSAEFPFRTYLRGFKHTKSWRCLWIVDAERIGCWP